MASEFEHHYNKYILKSLNLPSIHSKDKYDNGFTFFMFLPNINMVVCTKHMQSEFP